MKSQISEYIDAEKRDLELDCNVPMGIAILPSNFGTATSSDALVHESTTPTIRSLWRQAGIAETKSEKEGNKLPQRSKKSWEWVSPLIFISEGVLFLNRIPKLLNQKRMRKSSANATFVRRFC